MDHTKLPRQGIEVNKKYSILLSDPAWQYSSSECLHPSSRLDGKKDIPYPTMKLKDVKALKVQDLCEDDCLLFLWVTSPMLLEGLEVMEAWGFKYATIAFVWHKQMHNPGHYTMSECEICLVGKKGRIPSPRGSRKVRQFISEMRTKHSKKPEAVRDRIHEMFPTQAKLEMFARTKHEHFDSWGNEVESDIVL